MVTILSFWLEVCFFCGTTQSKGELMIRLILLVFIILGSNPVLAGSVSHQKIGEASTYHCQEHFIELYYQPYGGIDPYEDCEKRANTINLELLKSKFPGFVFCTASPHVWNYWELNSRTLRLVTGHEGNACSRLREVSREIYNWTDENPFGIRDGLEKILLQRMVP
jgi:hypothetical protein